MAALNKFSLKSKPSFFKHSKLKEDCSLIEDLQNLKETIRAEINASITKAKGKQHVIATHGRHKIAAIDKLISAVEGKPVTFNLADDYHYHVKKGRLKDILHQHLDQSGILKEIKADRDVVMGIQIAANFSKLGMGNFI
ncbi:hypothetical protein [Legionella maioricensis]|uniref:Uncharacterized protein n=1 Tax=Legionella maioricensis TaxID=2896528 RepID=A0A9X2D131_9GAMM|nr:hypothetical protein [Legionella maioricensis]MCL9684448.1 hypothetical protein [Legionella maioricensis]MCL9688849.1 hypothetical protein [Legionella maioricensis]